MLAAAVPLTTPTAPVNTTLRATDVSIYVRTQGRDEVTAILSVAKVDKILKTTRILLHVIVHRKCYSSELKHFIIYNRHIHYFILTFHICTIVLSTPDRGS